MKLLTHYLTNRQSRAALFVRDGEWLDEWEGGCVFMWVGLLGWERGQTARETQRRHGEAQRDRARQTQQQRHLQWKEKAAVKNTVSLASHVWLELNGD